MKTFVINLDKNPERLARFDEQANEVGIEYERIPAVYGMALSPEELRRSYHPFRAWCANGGRLLPGEIGCALSHLAVYRKMITEDIPVACVFEDDAILYPRLKEGLHYVEKWLGEKGRPHNAFINFRIQDCFTSNATDPFSCESVCGGMCTFGYVLTQAAARGILKSNYPVCVPADCFRRWIRQRLISYYELIPQIVSQDIHAFVSDIAVSSSQRTNVSLGLKQILRCLGWGIDRVMMFSERMIHG